MEPYGEEFFHTRTSALGDMNMFLKFILLHNVISFLGLFVKTGKILSLFLEFHIVNYV